MNIKRGVFRLWLVLSSLFVGAVLLTTWENITADFKHATENRWWLEFPSEEEYNLEKIISDMKQERLSAVRQEQPLDNDSWWDYINDPTVEEVELERRLSKMKQERLAEKYAPWNNLIRIAAFAFGIPLIILVIGSAFAWALSGFSRSQINR